MAKKLKTYQTSIGFYDLAVAAPSMKAALEAWGSGPNLFTHGLAKESLDPAVVAAAMAKPGVVLRRPVGSNAAFKEHAELPKRLPDAKVAKRPAGSEARMPASQSARAPDREAERRAAQAFEREQKERAQRRRIEEAALEKKREQRAR